MESDFRKLELEKYRFGRWEFSADPNALKPRLHAFRVQVSASLWGLLLSCAILWQSSPWASVAHDPIRPWYTLRTPHFVIHFHHGLDNSAQTVARVAERTHEQLSALFAWSPSQPTEIVLSDEVEVANGFSQPLPRNRLTLWITDPDEIESDVGPWLESLLVHEYAHTLHLDMASGAPNFLRSIFGRHPLLFPDQFQPAWIIEGLATFLETDAARGVGRGQSSYFEMLMRSEVIHGIKPLRQINQTIRTWPAGSAHYLYGVYFYKFIAERYGESRLWHSLKRYRGNLVPYRINSNAEVAFGKPLSLLWDDFGMWLRQRYQTKIEAILAVGTREGTQVSHHGYDTDNAVALPDGTIYYVRNDGRRASAIMRVRPGETDPGQLCEVNRDARIDAHPVTGVLIAQAENVRNAALVYDLFRCDENTKQVQRITRGQHYRSVMWAPDGGSMAALKSSHGHQSIVLLDEFGELKDVIRTTQGEERFGQFAWFPNGRQIVLSMRTGEGQWDLYRVDLTSTAIERLTFDAVIELNPRVVPDGTKILYSADYDGIYNIAQLNPGSNHAQLLTHVLGGAFYPSMSTDGNLIYLRYSAVGFDVARLDAAVPLREVDVAVQPPQEDVPIQTQSKESLRPFPVASYAPQPWLRPSWWSPLVVWDRDWRTIGFETASADALERHQYSMAASFDQNYDLLMGKFDYAFDQYFPVVELHVDREFSLYRIQDVVAFIRGRDHVSLGVTMPFINQRKRWASFIGFAGNREFDEFVAPGINRVSDLHDNVLGFAFNYDSTRSYPLSISRSDGNQINAALESSDIANSDYSGRVFSVDWRSFWPLAGEHVAALRFFQGMGNSESRHFQLGGNSSAGTPFIADRVGGVAPLNRRRVSLRGYPEGLTRLRGTDAQLFSAEWRFPLHRLERGLMVPPIGLDQLSGVVFVDSGGIVRNGFSPEESFAGVGMELYADTRFFYSIPVRIRVGVAHGMDGQGETQAYLTLGSAY